MLAGWILLKQFPQMNFSELVNFVLQWEQNRGRKKSNIAVKSKIFSPVFSYNIPNLFLKNHSKPKRNITITKSHS